MRKLAFVMILIFSIIYSGCATQSSQNLLFKGEGSFWRAELIEKLDNNANKTFDYILTYKNPDSKNIKAVSYTFKTGLAESSGTTSLDENKSIVHSTSNLAVKPHHVITVTVEWNDKKDIFEMVSVIK